MRDPDRRRFILAVNDEQPGCNKRIERGPPVGRGCEIGQRCETGGRLAVVADGNERTQNFGQRFFPHVLGKSVAHRFGAGGDRAFELFQFVSVGRNP